MLVMTDKYGFKRYVQAVQRGDQDPTISGATGEYDWQPYIVTGTSQVWHWNQPTEEWLNF